MCLKKLLTIITLLILFTILSTPKIISANETPIINYLAVDHSPLVEGEKQSFHITSSGIKNVQYRAFVYEYNTDKWSELTNGYTSYKNPKMPYTIAPSKTFFKGKYKLSFWVRAEGSTSRYDTFHVKYLDCINKDDNERISLDGNLITDKENYKIGEKVQINGIENIHGMKEPYMYKLHAYNLTKDKWISNITDYTKDIIEWYPQEEGIYILDIWSKSSVSTRTYDGWKLKPIIVSSPNINYKNYDYTLNDIVNKQYYSKNNIVYNDYNDWYTASKNDITTYLNPSSFLYDRGKLQFMKLNYIEGITVKDLNNILNDKGVLKGKGEQFLYSSKQYNINPAYLVSHSLLETGDGTTPLSTGVLVTKINGQAVEPKVTYNLFGIGAYDRDPIRLGAEYAYTQGWFSLDAAISGAAKWISDSYINHPMYNQNTLYKMKWNPENPGVHQYATDIAWAYKQTKNIEKIINQCNKPKIILEIPKYR
jgi:beta-N-acetylglucosaminidase